MANRLSFSSCKTFTDCPKSYELHYIRRLRAQVQSAALLFGTAIDRASTAIFKPEEGGKTAEQIFTYYWNFQEINGKNTSLSRYTEIAYPDSDFDFDLITDSDRLMLKDEHQVEDVKGEMKKILDWKKDAGYAALPTEQKQFINHCFWCCLKTKGLLMLKAIRTKIMPSITEVLSCQEQIKIENEDGDIIIGFIDLIARVKGYDKPVVLDLKTSKLTYSDNSNEVSPQLASYLNAISDKYESTRYVGFLVLSKTVIKNKTKICTVCGYDGSEGSHKTCPNEVKADTKKGTARCNGEWAVTMNPEVAVQIIISALPEQTELIVMQNYDYVNESIKTGNFPRNFNSCIKTYGKCQFYNLCYENKRDGLIKLEEKKNEG